MDLQAVYQIGKSFLYVPLVSLDENLYNIDDEIIIKFTKDNCRSFVVSGETELCADRIKITIDNNRCFDQFGRWNAILYTYSEDVELREEIGKIEVIVYENKVY